MKNLSNFQRKILSELMHITNDLGSQLDGTATTTLKFIERQRALMNVSQIIYGLFLDNPNNESRKEDIEIILENIKILKDLQNKVYSDRNGK